MISIILYNFPIHGDLRDFLLVVEWTAAFITLELGIIFILKYFRQSEHLKNIKEFGYASLFFGYSANWYFYIISDYFVSENLINPFLFWPRGSERILILNIAYLTLMLGAFFFILIMERYRKYFLKKKFFTYSFIVLFLGYFIVFFIDIELTQDYTFLFWPFVVIFFITYIQDFKKNVTKIVKPFVLPIFLLLFGGYFLATDIAVETFGIEIRLIGTLLELGAIIAIFYIFSSLPPFYEFDWKEKLTELYLIDKAGVCLFHKNFIDKIEFDEEHLISSALASINIILEELTQNRKDGFSVINKEGTVLIIYAGEYVNAVIFSKEELHFINKYLKKFVDRVESIYHNVLKSWDGDTNIFTPVESLIDEIFLEK